MLSPREKNGTVIYYAFTKKWNGLSLARMTVPSFLCIDQQNISVPLSSCFFNIMETASFLAVATTVTVPWKSMH